MFGKITTVLRGPIAQPISSSMPQYTCPHCQKVFSASTTEAPLQVLCPHCQQTVEVPATTASRWFLARAKKKHGPFTWRQLLTLAQRGDIARRYAAQGGDQPLGAGRHVAAAIHQCTAAPRRCKITADEECRRQGQIESVAAEAFFARFPGLPHVFRVSRY